MHQAPEAILGGVGVALEGFGVALEKTHLFRKGGGVGAGLTKGLDLGGEAVAIGVEGFELVDGFAAFPIDGDEAGEWSGGVGAAVVQAGQ